MLRPFFPAVDGFDGVFILDEIRLTQEHDRFLGTVISWYDLKNKRVEWSYDLSSKEEVLTIFAIQSNTDKDTQDIVIILKKGTILRVDTRTSEIIYKINPPELLSIIDYHTTIFKLLYMSKETVVLRVNYDHIVKIKIDVKEPEITVSEVQKYSIIPSISHFVGYNDDTKLSLVCSNKKSFFITDSMEVVKTLDMPDNMMPIFYHNYQILWLCSGLFGTHGFCVGYEGDQFPKHIPELDKYKYAFKCLSNGKLVVRSNSSVDTLEFIDWINADECDTKPAVCYKMIF